eukprot:COSAG02_NODE_3058_length_7451_cov_47.724701_7_plen_128_part_00
MYYAAVPCVFLNTQIHDPERQLIIALTTRIVAYVSKCLEVLQWARANDCEWNARTCSFAANAGCLEVLQWARANGCEWEDARTCSYAASRVVCRCCSGLGQTGAPTITPRTISKCFVDDYSLIHSDK